MRKYQNTYRIHIKQPMNMLSPLEKINTLILDCNNVLSRAGMNGISYSSKTGEIERLCGNIGIMNAYVGRVCHLLCCTRGYSGRRSNTQYPPFQRLLDKIIFSYRILLVCRWSYFCPASFKILCSVPFLRS